MINLPNYTGRAYRAESNLLIGGRTALDVVKFEEQELGNKQDFKHLDKNIRQSLATIAAKEITWVCRTKKEANRYGTAELIYLGKNPKIIAIDKEGGYLIFKGIYN